MSLQDNIYEQKYLKYKKKYIDFKDMVAGADLSFKLPTLNKNIFNNTPEQLVIDNRQKFQDAKLSFNKATNNVEDAKLKETFANKAYNKDKNNANLSKLNVAENTRKVAETAVSSAKRNIEFAKNEYKKSKEVARKLKLSNAEKAVSEAQNKLNNAQKELENVQREEQDRLSKKAFKNSSSDSSRSSSPKLLTDGSVDDE